MSSSAENFSHFAEPQSISFDMGEDRLPLNATIHSPFIISDWRASQYIAAVEQVLPEDATDEQLRALNLGCHWAANRSSNYSPYQTSTPRDQGGDRGELTREEIAVQRLLGNERFVQLQTMAPPPELINFILGGGSPTSLVRPKLSQITVAVIKGQITWEDRFVDAGVPLPDDYINQVTREEDEYRARLPEWYPNPQTRRQHKLLQTIGSVLKTLIR